MDFTIDKYIQFSDALKRHGAHARMYHDVDRHPAYALRIAETECAMGWFTTYYFRSLHFSSHAGMFRRVLFRSHNIGYHYESLATCRGNIDAAYADFCRNLAELRRLAPVHTASAHGTPRSPWDSQEIWRHHDIHRLDIDYEPKLDTDFSRTIYLTDTGRRWDGYHVNVWDKVPGHQQQWEREGLIFHSTDDIICALTTPGHPVNRHSLLVNTHPQRWMPFGTAWIAEALTQRIKNTAKWILIQHKSLGAKKKN